MLIIGINLRLFKIRGKNIIPVSSIIITAKRQFARKSIKKSRELNALSTFLLWIRNCILQLAYISVCFLPWNTKKVYFSNVSTRCISKRTCIYNAMNIIIIIYIIVVIIHIWSIMPCPFVRRRH